jgi:hypothetical protein
MIRRWLKPGGCAYIEFAPRRGWLGGYWRSITGWKVLNPEGRNQLQQLGFASIGAYWHHPNFEECRELIALNDAAALNFFLSRRRGDFAARVRGATGRWITRSGLLPQFVHSLSIVAVRSGARARLRN